MNTNQLKKFAQSARTKLMQQVAAKLELVLTTDSAALREQAAKRQKLRDEIDRTSKAQVVDKVAYTWFNRLMALRFMDANGYQPTGMKVVTPTDGDTQPELLVAAKNGNLPDDLKVNRSRINDWLDGNLPSNDPETEVYKALLIGACNHLATIFPFLFERIDDYAELLLPDDLLSEFSVVRDMIDGMTEEDCSEVELIGWLYQFYISERKDEVFAAKGKVPKEDIPAATQLFTPRWIVEYMVQNTLGKLWLQNKPNSKLREHMPYFIESPSSETVAEGEYLKVASVEEITLLDQACGSGHILVYAFDLFTKIYEEEGYSPSEIPKLIIEKNLHGFEIDTRAAQLAGLALMMKARSYQRRVFRKEITPNILCYKDLKLKIYEKNGKYHEVIKVKKDSSLLSKILEYKPILAENIEERWIEEFEDTDTGEFVKMDRKNVIFAKGETPKMQDIEKMKTGDDDEIAFFRNEIKDTFRAVSIPLSDVLYNDLLLMKQATNFGSLIQPKTSLSELAKTLNLLQEKSNTSDVFLQLHLDELKTALYQLIQLGRKYHCVVDNPPYMGGGNMNKPLADFVKKNYKISKADLMACFMEAGLNMLYAKGFLGMINQHSWMFLSSYEKLREQLIKTTFFDTLLHLGPRTFPEIGGEVVQNAAFVFWKKELDKKGVYLRLTDFKDAELKTEKTLEAIKNPDCGWFFKANQKDFENIPLSPLGYWLNKKMVQIFKNEKEISEVGDAKVGIQTGDNELFLRIWNEVSNNRIGNFWINYDKGGEGRKWYGNKYLVVNWDEEGRDIRHHEKSVLRNKGYHFLKSIQWSRISSGRISARFTEGDSLFDINSASLFFKKEEHTKIGLAYLNSKVCLGFLVVLAPTLTFQVGDIGRLPIKLLQVSEELVDNCVDISKTEWNSRETSWDFQKNELLRHSGQDLEESYDLYCQYWKNKFFQLHKNEEALNRQFIDIYGLQEELTPDVPLEDITILKAELDRTALSELSKRYAGDRQAIGDRQAVIGDWSGDTTTNPQPPTTKNQSPTTNPQPPNLPFDRKEVIAQFVSYAVGCMFGRYSLEVEGLVLANQAENLEDYVRKVVGDWWLVDGSGNLVFNKNKNINEYYEKLQRSENLAAEYQARQNDLSSDAEDAKGGNVQSDQSDKKSSGQRAEQHSRGAITGNEGVHPLSSDSTRLTVGTPNSTDPDSGIGNDRASGDRTTTEGSREHQQTNQQPDDKAQSPLTTNPQPPITFLPDDDNIIPVLDDEWFEDDIVGRFYEFLKITFGEKDFKKNLAFVEEALGKSIRKYLVKDFYNDHIKRYKKRPIYWMFSSPKGSFNVLVYLHRYTPDTLNTILNDYLVEYREKLKTKVETLQTTADTGTSAEKIKAEKEQEKIKKVLHELQEYEREILYPVATERIAIDLDDGVLVNYNKFGKAIKLVKGLNDAKAKTKVRGFDWIEVAEIRD